jgi:transposase
MPCSWPAGAGQPGKWDRRLVLDAIFYLVPGGIAWRALPADFPPPQTVYARFRRWTRARAWCRIYAALRERARLADGGKKIKGCTRHVAVDTGGLLTAATWQLSNRVTR